MAVVILDNLAFPGLGLGDLAEDRSDHVARSARHASALAMVSG